MAALTATTTSSHVVGSRRNAAALLPAVSDADTYDTGLIFISPGTAQVTSMDAAAVAADSIAIETIVGGVIKFQVAGTARAANVTCHGY